jgi:hypothetical protein
VRALPILVLGLLSGTAMASVVVLLLVPEIRAKRETSARIAACHDKGGTARLDRRDVYRGCHLPPKVAR